MLGSTATTQRKTSLTGHTQVAPVTYRFPAVTCSAKQYLPFFQRAGRVAGVCEYVLSGHRVKVHVPKEGVTVAFSPSGVRAPQRGQAPSRDGRAATEVCPR